MNEGGAMVEERDFDDLVRSGIDLGGDHFAKLEYRLATGELVVYPASYQVPDSAPPHSARVVGLVEYHRNGDGAWCGGWVGFTNVPGHGDNAQHQLDSIEPLTVSPSLQCTRCPAHGFIREGKWVVA